MNDMTFSLAVCKIIFFLHFGEAMPDCLTYQSAVNQVFDVVDWKAFDKLVAEAKLIEADYVEFGMDAAIALHADTSIDHIDSDQESV